MEPRFFQQQIDRLYEIKELEEKATINKRVRDLASLISQCPADVKTLKREYQQLTGKRYYPSNRTSVCTFCRNKGYVEVCMSDEINPQGWQIQACGECDYFGIITRKGEKSLDEKAQDKARREGVKMDDNGYLIK